MAELNAVCKRHNAVLYVDDAHGTGVLGRQGRGTVRDALGGYDNTLVVGSLSKAFSCFGGFVGCPREFKTLLKTAKEPPEHRKIAEYYRQEAQRLTASSKEHAEMAEFYAKNPPFPRALEAKHGDVAMGASHCRKWAELESEEAKEAESLAALHEEMAKAAEQKAQ